MNKALFDYIRACPTPFHALSHTAKLLSDEGFRPLCESGDWKIERGGKYYVTRNLSSLIAFTVPKGDFSSFMITASHGDSPAFCIKENAELEGAVYTRLSAERYGSLIFSSWMDRLLGIAGRAAVRTADGISVRLADLGGAEALIPNTAIHLNRKINDGAPYDAAVDMVPLCGITGETVPVREKIADTLGVSEADIISTELYLYNPQEGAEWGGMISAPRLDDLQCAFAAQVAFRNAKADKNTMPVYCLFDNEEVGSRTKQGAASTFLSDVLVRISDALGEREKLRRRIASGFLVSCDNAHALHPNRPELADKNHTVTPNGGVVIKHNANRNYTTDAVSSAIMRELCRRAGVPVQDYANRADMPGGSTLGNIANTQVSLNTADIGLAQLAMHSAYETAGARDTEYLVRALEAFYSARLEMTADGEYILG